MQMMENRFQPKPGVFCIPNPAVGFVPTPIYTQTRNPRLAARPQTGTNSRTAWILNPENMCLTGQNSVQFFPGQFPAAERHCEDTAVKIGYYLQAWENLKIETSQSTRTCHQKSSANDGRKYNEDPMGAFRTEMEVINRNC